MDVHLLGPIEAYLDGRPIALGAPKQRAVLAMLALQVGRPVSVDRLAEGLWGERCPPSAAKMVQLYVSQLRRLVAGNGAEILTRGRGYELRLSDGDVDAVRFVRLLEGARAREALALWRGAPLCDVADEPFAAAEIRRLEDLRLQAAERAIGSDLAAGRHREVLAELEALLAAEPLREGLQAQRMLALYRSGRQAEALNAYQEARALLVEQVGVEPGPELRRLQHAILIQDPALDLPPLRAAPVRPRTRRRLPAMVATAAVLVLTGSLAFAGVRLMRPDGLARVDPDHVGVIDGGDPRIADQYPVGHGAGAVVAGGGSVWVANTLDGTVSRIDPQRRLVTIDVGGAPSGLTFGAGSLWVADGEGHRVAQVDPGTNTVVQHLDAGNAPRAVITTHGALWSVSGVDRAVRRIALGRTLASRSIHTGSTPSAIAAGAGAVWVASDEAGTVTRIDARSGTIVRPIAVGRGPSAVAWGEGAVWVVNRDDGTLARIDPATNAVSWSLPVGRDPIAVAAGDGAVWVAHGDTRTLTRVDPRAPRVLDTLRIGSSPSALAIADGGVWTAALAPQSSHRGETLRVRYPVARPYAVPVDWLHPLGASWETTQITSLAYDGLVGYRRVAGIAGGTLVGALATDVPVPSRDGLTYRFTLRPGLRYSDGTPVRPRDFGASVRRMLVRKGSDVPPYYAGIIGASRCAEEPRRCDLSAGIETDESARTITIHLARADSDFLHKLTSPFAYVVPAGSEGRGLPPGTGPYRVAVWDMRSGGSLVRNSYFQPRPAQSRPAGFADRIEIRFDPDVDVEAAISEVYAGTTDLLALASPFGSFVDAARVRALTAGSPGRLHGAPAASTDWMFLNVLRRPFDDLRVRRALNYATDRRRIVALGGGSALAAPTCQVVPAGMPGYATYCPYTAGDGPGRPWTAPDLSRARALVAASGRTGERIVVTVPEFRRRVGRYFVTLLEDLGFRASLRVLGSVRYFDAVYDPRTRMQMGFMGWNLDYVSASNFVQAHFTCASQAERERDNASYFCDPPLARLVDRASASDAADAWAPADRRIADLAPAVPLTNRRSLVLVSKRAGNVQIHPAGSTLLDQVWVR